MSDIDININTGVSYIETLKLEVTIKGSGTKKIDYRILTHWVNSSCAYFGEVTVDKSYEF